MQITDITLNEGENITVRVNGVRIWIKAQNPNKSTTGTIHVFKDEHHTATPEREAVEHIQTLPPSERSAVENRPGQFFTHFKSAIS